MILDLTTFEKAFNSLKVVWDVYQNKSNDDITRDSVIQRFEYTYSMALKMISRFLSLCAFEDDEQILTFNELIRTANQNNLLLGNLETWTDYRAKRNMTSHAYDEKKAMEVISIIDAFIKETDFLMRKLNEKIAG